MSATPRSGSGGSRSRRRWLLGLIAPLALTGLVLWLVRTPEPSYQGRSASAWLDLLNEPPMPGRPSETWEEITSAFQAMGPDAGRLLARELEGRPSWLQARLSELKYGSALPGWLKKRIPERHDHRRDAAAILPEIGSNAEPALPVLLRIYHGGEPDEMVRSGAHATLAALGDKIEFLAPELIQNLIDGRPHSQVLCAHLLGSIGPKAKAAIPALEAALKEGGWLTREAAWALLKIDGRTNLAVEVLIQGLSHTNSSLRQFVFSDLSQLGPAASPALPKIQQALWDPDDQIREAAVRVLRELDPPRLERSIRQMNDDLPAQVRRLIDTIQGDSFPRCSRAIDAVAVIGPTAKAAVPALIDILNATSPDQVRLPGNALSFISLSNLKRQTARALGEIGPDAGLAVPALVERIRDQRDMWKQFYCQALGRIGPAAADALPALREVLADEALGVQRAAAIALMRIDPQQCSDAIQALKAFQVDADPHVRLEVAAALWPRDRTLPSPVSALIQKTKEREAWAIEFLGDLGFDAKDALPALTDTLKQDASGLSGREAAIAIRKIDPEAAARLGLPGLLALP